MLTIAVTAAIGYVLGSIPFGYLLVRVFRGADVRQSGSGNIGATNVARTSPMLGVATLVLDALKGLVAAVLAARLFAAQPSSRSLLVATAALFAILGHIFPLWLRFRGGKGVATGLGSFAVLAPKTILVLIGIFAAVVLASRYVSLGSIVAVAAFPFLLAALREYGEGSQVLVLAGIASALIIAKHHQNLRRLIGRTENKLQLRRG